jgi:TPR repeat protein
MHRTLSVLIYVLFVAYIVPASLSAVYFNYQYFREHEYVDWLLFGARTATLKGVAWPYFVWERFNAASSFDNNMSLLAEQGNAEAQNKLGLAVQDDAEVVKWFRKGADQGLAEAQNNLGGMYANGRGVAQDDAEAVRWYRKAADQGLALAENNLGFMYTNGRGVAQDYAKAVAWYRKAADQGLAEAQNNLGGMYDTGRGMPHDDAEAVRWFRKAADQGLALAQLNLAICYSTGQSVPQDYVQAHKWLTLAAARFPASESEKRDRAVKLRDLLAGKMTSAQIAEAQTLARDWKPK